MSRLTAEEARRDNYAETGVQTISAPCTETPSSVKSSPALAKDNQGMLSQVDTFHFYIGNC